MESGRVLNVNRSRNSEGMSRQALQFFGLSALAVTVAMLLAWCLARYVGKLASGEQIVFAPAFAVSSLLLFAGSFALQKSLNSVRVERQREFRAWLLGGLFFGTMFMGVQSYALWSMLPTERAHESASTGVTAFVMCLATLHGLHFLIAVLFVSLIVSRTWADRYDHEYFWGVRVCAWFWHALGIVWIAILAVIAIAA